VNQAHYEHPVPWPSLLFVIQMQKGPAYAFSMAKLPATGTKAAQLGFAEVFDFLGIRWLVLFRVAAIIALITRRSNHPEKGKMSPSNLYVQ
jgi:hypothetical protein